jgi:hypothetical protein
VKGGRWNRNRKGNRTNLGRKIRKALREGISFIYLNKSHNKTKKIKCRKITNTIETIHILHNIINVETMGQGENIMRATNL